MKKPIFRGEAHLCYGGPLILNTGKWTARAANDKYIVREESTEDKIWWGIYNRPMSPEKFSGLLTRLQAYWQGEELFVQDCYVGADPELPDADPDHHRKRLAEPVRAQHVHPAAHAG